MENRSIGEEAGQKKMKKIILISLIIAIGFLIRTYIWFDGWNPSEQGFTRGDDYLPRALLMISSEKGFVERFLISRPLYPIYLTPIYIFGLTDHVYVFWLHHLFVALTTIFIYLFTSKIGQSRAGMLAAFIYACQFQIASWFDWDFPGPAFHFQLSLFAYCSLLCWERASGRHIFLMALSGLMLSLTRPEGGVILLASLLVLAYRSFEPRFGATRVRAVILGSILLFSLSGIFMISQSKVVREAVLSQWMFGYAFFYNSQETSPNPVKVDAMLGEMHRFCGAKARSDPEKRNKYYWCSVTGLERIKNDPVNYIRVFIKRIPHLVYPSFVREGVSWRYKLIDRTIMSFITIGLICVFVFRFKGKPEAIGLIIMALPIYAILNFAHSEYDVRLQLSAHILLIPVASLGWIVLANLVYKKFQPIQSAPE